MRLSLILSMRPEEEHECGIEIKMKLEIEHELGIDFELKMERI